MKKFLYILFISMVSISILDYCWGKFCLYLNSHSKGGSTEKNYTLAEETIADIIMMGSSRMAHHYAPQVFEDSLHLSCFNAGADGNGIIMSYGFYSILSLRYHPQILIYDVCDFDLFVDDNTKYLGWLKAYYQYPCIKDIFNDIEPHETSKMVSNFYRFNSKWIGLLGNYIHPAEQFDRGFQPKYSKMDYEIDRNKRYKREIDPIKIGYLKKLIESVKNSGGRFVFVASPYYNTNLEEGYFKEIEELAQEYDIEFYQFADDIQFSNNKSLFYDSSHMNYEGAIAFSSMIAHLLLKK